MRMNMHESFALSEETACRAPDRSSWLGLVRLRLVACVKTRASHYAAAVAYEPCCTSQMRNSSIVD